MAGQAKTDPLRDQREEDFIKAFDEYSVALFRHATLRLNNDREKAIDLVHDTFTKAWLYIKNGHQIDTYRPFLYKVLNNLIIDTYRKQGESSLDALFEQEGVSESSFGDLVENTSEALAATIDGKQAFALLATLPDVYKEVLILKFVDELGPKEISQLIEETENVVSVRIHRGLKFLRDKMNNEILQRETNLSINSRINSSSEI